MNEEIATCDFCRAESVVTRQYLHAKNKPPVGDGFAFVMYCSRCGLDETVSQPLTEGEEKNRDDQRDRMTVSDENRERKRTDVQRSRYTIQESNKEEEPSKKPSMTIGCIECGNNIKI